MRETGLRDEIQILNNIKHGIRVLKVRYIAIKFCQYSFNRSRQWLNILRARHPNGVHVCVHCLHHLTLHWLLRPRQSALVLHCATDTVLCKAISCLHLPKSVCQPSWPGANDSYSVPQSPPLRNADSIRTHHGWWHGIIHVRVDCMGCCEDCSDNPRKPLKQRLAGNKVTIHSYHYYY